MSELALRLEMMHLRFSDAPQFWQRQSVKAIGQGRKQKEGVQELKGRKRLAKGDVDQGVAPGFSGVHGGSYGFQRTADQAPSAVTENYNRKRSALQILLEAKILSVVSSTSNPASSATFNSSPLVSVSQPCAFASLTVRSGSARAMPRGVPWSKRTSI